MIKKINEIKSITFLKYWVPHRYQAPFKTLRLKPETKQTKISVLSPEGEDSQWEDKWVKYAACQMKGSTRKKTGLGNRKGGARDQSTGRGFRYDGLGQPHRETDPWAKIWEVREEGGWTSRESHPENGNGKWKGPTGRACWKVQRRTRRPARWAQSEPGEGMTPRGQRSHRRARWPAGAERAARQEDACCWRALCRGMLWFDLSFCFKFYFIYLAMLGLSWSTRGQARWSGVELRPSALGTQSFSHQTTREAPDLF